MSTLDEGPPILERKMGSVRTHGSGGKRDPRKVGAQVSDQTLLPPGPRSGVGVRPPGQARVV